MRRPATSVSGRRMVDARLHLLDRQVLDSAGRPVTTVADLEIVGDDGDAVPGAPAHVAAILSWPVLVTRVLGGDPPPSRWQRIAWSDVGHVGVTVELTVPGEALDLDWVERWVRDHIIGRIPGGLHDPEEEQ